MAILQTCCGCFTVQDGSMIVGIFSFILFSIYFVGALPYLPYPKSLFLDAIGMHAFKDFFNPYEEILRVVYTIMTVLVSINAISSVILILGIKHRNRFLLLPWIIWTGLTMMLSQVWMILSTTPVLMGDVVVLILFVWGEMCVISHFQNLRDGVTEMEDIANVYRLSSSLHARGMNPASAALWSSIVNNANHRSEMSRQQQQQQAHDASSGRQHDGQEASTPNPHFHHLVMQDGVSDPCPPSLSQSSSLLQPASVLLPQPNPSVSPPPPPYPGPSGAETRRYSSIAFQREPKLSMNELPSPPPSYDECVSMMQQESNDLKPRKDTNHHRHRHRHHHRNREPSTEDASGDALMERANEIVSSAMDNENEGPSNE